MTDRRSDAADAVTDGLTYQQLRLLRHTLGLCLGKESYRNHFVAGESHNDYRDLQLLVEMGYMRVVPTPSFVANDAIVYQATNKGKEAAAND